MDAAPYGTGDEEYIGFKLEYATATAAGSGM